MNMFTIDGKITALVIASLLVALFFPDIPRTVSFDANLLIYQYYI